MVVAAYDRELLPFVTLKTKYLAFKNNVAFLAAGIGPTAASFGLTHFLEDYQPKVIISLGTAGIINPKKLNIGDIAWGDTISAFTKTRFSVGSVTYKDVPTSASKAVRVYLKEGLYINSVRVYAPQDITLSVAHRRELCRQGFDAENLEAYAFAFVAAKFQIPHVSLFGMTNLVGPGMHAEWRKNEAALVKKMGCAAKGILENFY